MKITFTGLGIMGSRMAANLLKNGVNLTVYNRSSDPMDALIAQGAKGADSLQAAVLEADIVFSMLSTPEVVKSCFFGPSGALTKMKPNAIWVDCTTVNPSFSLEAAAEAKANGVRFLDAPVAGTKPQAAAASLAFFVGGEAQDLAEVKAYLDHM